MKGPGRARIAVLVAGLASFASSYAHAAGPTQQACLDAAERGQKLRNEGRLLAARESFLVCQTSSCPTIVRDDCTKWLGELSDALPTIVISVHDERGLDVFDAEVTLDGAKVPGEKLGYSMPIDPGRHTFKAVRGESVVEQLVLVQQAVKGRAVELRFEPTKPKEPQKEPPKELVLPPPKLVPVTPRPVARPAFFGTQRYVALGVGATGAVSLLAGAFVGASFNASIADLREGCGKTSSCRQDEVDAQTGKRTTAYVLTGVGAALLVTSAVLFLTGKPRAHEAPTVSLVLPPGGAALSLSGRF